MCLYADDGTTTPIYPPDDLDYDRVKSTDHEPDDGEWRLVTVEWGHVFNPLYAGNPYQLNNSSSSLVKGYGRITVLEKYPAEVFYEFAFWNIPTPNADLPADEEQPSIQPFWDSRDVHWEHTWQNYFHRE